MCLVYYFVNSGKTWIWSPALNHNHSDEVQQENGASSFAQRFLSAAALCHWKTPNRWSHFASV